MSEQAGRISNGVTFIAIWTYVGALALVLIATLTFMASWRDTNERHGNVGRSTGSAVVEQYDTSWVTSDPTANYLIPATNTTLPEAAPGATP